MLRVLALPFTLLMCLSFPTVGTAFTTDYFYQICNAIIITNDAFDICTNGTETTSKLSDDQRACLFRNDNYLRTMYACVEKAGYLADVKNAARLSWNALDVACRNVTDGPLYYTYDEIETVVNAHPITNTFQYAEQYRNTSFECPDSMLTKQVIKAGIAYNANVYASNVYGFGTVCYVGGIILIQCLLNLSKAVAPRIYQRAQTTRIAKYTRAIITLPAMFGFKRAVPLQIPLKVFNWDVAFPPRLHSLLLSGYVVLCTTLLVIKYDFVTTQFSYSTKVEAVTKLVGYRSGYFAMYKLPMLVLFASKNNILMWATGWGYDVFNHWHRALGRLFLLDIVVHAACYSRWGQWAGIYLFKWQTFPPWIAAQTATMAAGIMCLMGNKTIRSKCYDVFRATHVLLAVVVMIGVYVHISYFQLALWPFYITLIIWGCERISRGLRIAWSGLFASALITECPGEILRVDLKHGGWRARGGSYVFVHFLSDFECLNPHPFTVVSASKTSRSQLYIKARTGRTRKILEQVRAHGPLGSSMYMPLWLEGPYGHDFDKSNFEEIIFIAGGVGITGAFSHLDAVCRLGRPLQLFSVYWTVPTIDWLDTFHELIEYMRADPRILLEINVTRLKDDEEAKKMELQIVAGRPNLDSMVERHCQDSVGPTCFFTCGPPIMCDSVRALVAAEMVKTSNYVEYNEECFSM